VVVRGVVGISTPATVTGCSIFMAFPGFLVDPAVRTINAAERAR
jgi:hypothetical protein